MDLVDDAPDLELAAHERGDPELRLVLWHGERDVEGVRGHGRLFPDGLELSLELHDGVLETADSIDLDGDDVSRARPGESWPGCR